ncbi:phytase [Novosphingobium huizhouense]|uniref:phytase n=1 Tax=Novosphingobium huizhouense TaxID=2866625 RepID=UPI001CD8D2DE|nr:phytase [Novosphingobium huizhouense]
MRGAVLGLLAGMALAGPASAAPVTVEVTAKAETAPVGTGNADAADDPAIWRNPANPAASLIVATDKKAGLYLYGLDGRPRDFSPDGRLNNVDLVDMGAAGVIVVASDRNDEARAKLRLYRLDTRAAKLVPLGTVEAGWGEGYGVCLWRQGKALHAFSVMKHGFVSQVAIDLSGAAPAGEIVRWLKLATQTEGCVVDPRSATLFVGEEDRGIWAFDARAGAAIDGRLVAEVDGAQLVADVEGLALAPVGRRGGWLVASSQGDNAYALFKLPGMTPAGRFRIAAGKLGATEETDGIALATGSFGGQYPAGLFVAQDGENAPAAQNFKLVSWADVLAALNGGSR